MSNGERLQKVLAGAGVASRRECETLISEGRVEVDGDVVRTLGVRVDPANQEIRVDGEPLATPKLAYYAVHKPQGVVSTSRDPSGRPRVTDLVPPDAGRLFAVGRLDMSSEGLMILTNDGDLAHRLTHPRYGVRKEYRVQVAGQVEQETVKPLKTGVRLDEGTARAESVKIKNRYKKSTVLEIVLKEGRNREIRRLLARVGHKVQRLLRTAIGPVRLGDLPPAAYRRLDPQEIAELRKIASEPQQGGPDQPGTSGRAKQRTKPHAPARPHAGARKKTPSRPRDSGKSGSGKKGSRR